MLKNILFVLLVFVQITVFGQAKNFIDQPYIEVQGVAEMNIMPNELYITIQVKEKEKKGSKSLEEMERQMLLQLKTLGIDVQKNVTVRDFASNFKYYWFGRSNILKRKEYQIKVQEAQTLGKIYMEMEKIGISDIRIDRVNHSEIEKFRRQVKINAIKVAKEKAVQMIEAIGQKVTKVIYVQENSYNPRANTNVSNFYLNEVANGSFGKTEGGKPNLPKINFEKIKLKYSVTARFAIE